MPDELFKYPVTKKVRERCPEARNWKVSPETKSAIRQMENVFLNVILQKAKQMKQIKEIPDPDDYDTINRITITWKHKEFIETEELKIVLLIELAEMTSCVKLMVKPKYIIKILIERAYSYVLFEWIQKEVTKRYESGQIPTRVKQLYWKCESSLVSFLLLFNMFNPQYYLVLEMYEFVKEETNKPVGMKQWQNLEEIQVDSFFPGNVERLLEPDVIKSYILVEETEISNIIEVSS
ncbi:hypothetical protein GCK72_022429 [Caenorhabditis remanei]|uniref:Uncharacterized protein n=1 Tax=Caenorhabditis remanei TaxID=31234 RepID=A0A6A5FU08_CAERE|nr:hypothetical protein GCK72_022429 [Caenorhabditis remanei]KAF1745979.1 hypothetical protein GCK72_022429 [Caenorhabditis remanei]